MSELSDSKGHEERERSLGRLPGMYRVVDLFDDDKDETLEIKLTGVDYFPSGLTKPLPRSHVHWAIMWHLEDRHNVPCYRFLQVVTERYFYKDAEGKEAYRELYTNWGPHTKSVSETEGLTSLRVTIGSLDLNRRKKLEAIASQEAVKPPDGKWNCQSWIRSVLEKGVGAKLLEEEKVIAALETLSSDKSLIEWLAK